LKNFGGSRHSNPPIAGPELLAVCLLLMFLIAGAAAWCFRHGSILYYGDAQAHLDISRSIIDSRTPGYDQLGTVWLPLLHVICLPLAGNMNLWSTGLAGTIPVAICFVIAGIGFYLAAREAYQDRLAAGIVLACFALNPNLLYLASIPMTEIVFLAGLAVMLFALVRFRRTQRMWLLALGIAASWSMSLTRYDGWFLIPFSAIAFALTARVHRWHILFIFAAAAVLAPGYWMAHNWWETGNAIDFFNGPYSPAAIQGSRSYPGYHNWAIALGYYAAAGESCCGWGLFAAGVAGLICALFRRGLLPLLFLLLTPAFYVWSIHSSKTPIFVPQLWPHTYYNSRYGIAVIAVAAFAAGAIVLVLRRSWRRWAPALVIIAVLPWLLQPSPEHWICWKESQVNSASRRVWTESAARYLEGDYRGQGIWAPFGDVTGIFCRAKIPLREVLHEGNGPAWFTIIRRPDLYHPTLWAIAQNKDAVWNAIQREPSTYIQVKEIFGPEPPALIIYRRNTP
jgi:hypothetical protein